MIEYRLYLDNIEEIISLHYKVSKPPDYVRCTPILFSSWEEWAQIYEEEKNASDVSMNKEEANTSIRPMGERIAPDWVKYEFQNLEEFYQYYTKLLKIGD